jgi:protocatechuate 3,4-dioxygenase beta subunit
MKFAKKILAMTTKTNFIFLVIFTSLLLSCNGQTTPNSKNTAEKSGIIGGPFENGEFLYIGMPENIKSIDTSAGWTQKGQKLLVTGTIYKLDGKTPAPNVILYYYHTNINGVYAGKQGLDPRVVRHGYIRGWVKSDANGKYAIYTVRPAPYPNTNFEAHIHPAIKEPTIDKEYYIDEFVFDDDKLLTGEKRKKLENRGGSGILRVLISGDLQIAEHNIILGLNIPNYPKTNQTKKLSGLEIGEDNNIGFAARLAGHWSNGHFIAVVLHLGWTNIVGLLFVNLYFYIFNQQRFRADEQ